MPAEAGIQGIIAMFSNIILDPGRSLSLWRQGPEPGMTYGKFRNSKSLIWFLYELYKTGFASIPAAIRQLTETGFWRKTPWLFFWNKYVPPAMQMHTACFSSPRQAVGFFKQCTPINEVRWLGVLVSFHKDCRWALYRVLGDNRALRLYSKNET
jgi:hypothetical protein